MRAARLLHLVVALALPHRIELSAQVSHGLGWVMSAGDTTPLGPLPSDLDWGDFDPEFAEGEVIRGTAIDLDGDGTADFVLRAGVALCGATGNCEFAVVDGKSHRMQGRISGAYLVVTTERMHEWPVIQSWSNLGADSGVFATYANDGAGYRRVASLSLSGPAREAVLKALRQIIPRVSAAPALPTDLRDLVGDWHGTNKLWVRPGEPMRESETRAAVALVAGSGYLSIRYTWSDKGEPQDGELLLRLAPDLGDTDMVWVDSWHQAPAFMPLRGVERSPEHRVALGSYAAGSGPPWGWRIAVTAEAADRFVLRMYNLTPDGAELLAVEAVYRRVMLHERP